MNSLTRHLVLILALICINQPVYAQVSNGEGFEPLEGVPSPDEFVPPIQNKQSINSQPTSQTLGYINSGGLTWAPIKISAAWTEARDTCSRSTALGYMAGSWRQPTKDELVTLYAAHPNYSATLRSAGWYLNFTWSSTNDGAGGYYAVGLVDGQVFHYTDDIPFYVSCVHDGDASSGDLILEKARLMIGHSRGAEALEGLLSLANNGDARAMTILAKKYNVGINGIPIDKTQAKIWTTKLEAIFNSQSKDKELAIRSLCEIFKNENGVLYNQEKEIKYCKIYYESGKVDGDYAAALLDRTSPFYDPKKGLELYKNCINKGNSFCKWNFAWQGQQSTDIARGSSGKQLFEYASADLEKNNPSALNNLGVFYENGFGTTRDLAKAIELYKKAAKSGINHGFYNLLRVVFFKSGNWKDGPKNVDEANNLLAYYDYLSDSNDGWGSVPFKQWLFENKRLPTNSNEFETFLRDEANKGDAASACMLSDHLLRNHQAQESMKYALMGTKTNDRNIQKWCSKGIDRVNVSLILSGMKPLSSDEPLTKN